MIHVVSQPLADVARRLSRRRPPRRVATSVRVGPLGAATTVALAMLVASAAPAVGASVDGTPPSAGPTAATPAAEPWSTPTTVSACASANAPAVVFPSSRPQDASGPGALLWTGGQSCASASASGMILLAPLSAQDTLEPARLLLAGQTSRTTVKATTGTTVGQILIGAHDGATSGFTEGRATSSFATLTPLTGVVTHMAAASGYLGDAALATVSTSDGVATLQLRTQRHYERAPSAPVAWSLGSDPVTALAVTLDFRSDALVAWAQDGSIYAREVQESGTLGPTQVVGPSPPHPKLQALISDDQRAIVAWESFAPAVSGVGSTEVRLSISGPAVRFTSPPLVVESFQDPGGLVPAHESLGLVRLSTESVMMAWTGASSGHYVVRVARVSLTTGATSAGSISPAAQDSWLSDFASGPEGDVLALWMSAPRGAQAFDLQHVQLQASRGTIGAYGQTDFGPLESVASGAIGDTPIATFDPSTDRVVAAWVTAGSHPALAYAVRAAGPASAVTSGALAPITRDASLASPLAARASRLRAQTSDAGSARATTQSIWSAFLGAGPSRAALVVLVLGLALLAVRVGRRRTSEAR